MMDAAAENAKVEPSTNLDREWRLAFAKYQPAAIEWAFREHMRTCKYYPAISDIQTLISTWATNQKYERQERELRENRARRESGEGVGIVDVMAKFNEVMKAKAEVLQAKPVKNRAELEKILAEVMERRAKKTA